MSDPDVSIVIPVYNEATILEAAIEELVAKLNALGWSYEVMLAENGSRDGTAELGQALGQRFPCVRSLSVGEPNYGRALRQGIAEARDELVICDEIDLCDVEFYLRATELLRTNEAELVIGSKLVAGAADERPWMRHAASQLYNGLLRLSLGFRGTDTHGLKAFRRAVVAPIAARCVVEKDVFASELVIRAYREGVRVREIPVRLHERRPPSVDLIRRVPNVLRNLAKLAWAIRVHG